MKTFVFLLTSGERVVLKGHVVQPVEAPLAAKAGVQVKDERSHVLAQFSPAALAGWWEQAAEA